MSITHHPNSSVTLCKDRVSTVLECAYELEMISLHLPKLITDGVDNPAFYILRTYAARINELASITMSAAADDTERPAELLTRVTLQKAVTA